MNPRGPAWLWGVLAFVIGALPAFALAGPILFAAHPVATNWGALGLFGIAMLVLGFGGGALAGPKRVAIGWGLALPILLVLALATWGSTQTYLVAALFVVEAGVGAWAGVTLGALLTATVMARRRK